MDAENFGFEFLRQLSGIADVVSVSVSDQNGVNFGKLFHFVFWCLWVAEPRINCHNMF